MSSSKQHAANLGERLQRSLRAGILEVSAPVDQNKEFAQRLGITAVLASRVRKLLATTDPIQALLVSPGEGPLRLVATGLERLGASDEACARIDQVLTEIRGFIAAEAGDRRALETLFADHMEGGRAAFEAPRRQAAFRALAEARGLHAELIVHTAFLLPVGEAGVKFSTLLTVHALERSRADAQHSWLVHHREGPAPALADGSVIHGHESGALHSNQGLVRFCRNPPAPLQVAPLGPGLSEIRVGPTGFGPASRVDIVSFEESLAQASVAEPAAGALRGVGFTPQLAARRAVVEVFVHQGLFGGRPPITREASTCDLGPLDLKNLNHRLRLRSVAEPMQELGSGLDALDLPEVHLRRALLEDILGRLGQDPLELKGYRLDLAFPPPWYQFFHFWRSLD